MIYRRIVDLIKRDPERLAASWCSHIKRSEVTVNYHRLSDAELIARHTRVFEGLAQWLEHSMTRDELNRFYSHLGRERYAERFPLCQVQYALLIAKRNFWELVQSQGLLDSSLEFYQAMQLMSSIDLYFDLGTFYIIRGYMDAMSNKLQESAGLTDEQLQDLVFTADPQAQPEVRVGVKAQR
ncbi:MAG: hypothetical protein EHM23_26160 [Acidobacteria bacterium]|nr:MAG: hypothetical protein EHM23_26160 [Acidobacteriota bacterium]